MVILRLHNDFCHFPCCDPLRNSSSPFCVNLSQEHSPGILLDEALETEREDASRVIFSQRLCGALHCRRGKVKFSSES
jgi:hypothetical protein